MTRPGLVVFLPFRNEPELLDVGKLAGDSSLGLTSERRVGTLSGSFGTGGDSVCFGLTVGFGVGVIFFLGASSMRGGVYLRVEGLVAGAGAVFVFGAGIGAWRVTGAGIGGGGYE